jgi:uncharacterized protein (DUF2235 family)
VSALSKIADEMIAWNLDSHVQNGYEFLMQTYRHGDSICIFGFSRGAYTARALAGMLHKVGLLSPHNFQQVPFAYRMYMRDDPVGWAQSTAFKSAFCREVEIKFIGVWDTVSSVGLIPRRLPFTTSNTIVHHFRHALALDERRAKFKANTWNMPTKEEEKLGTPPPTRANTQAASNQPKKANKSPFAAVFAERTSGDSDKSASSEQKCTEEPERDTLGLLFSKSGRSSDSSDDDDLLQDALQQAYEQRSKHVKETDVEEVWFSGCHCDVGGGSVKNESPHALSRIPLRWMIRECFKTKSGIMFDVAKLKEIGLDPNSLYPYVVKRPEMRSYERPSIRSIPGQSESFTRSLFKRRRKQDCQGTTLVAKASCTHGPAGELRSGNEEEEDILDALEPCYDQLSLRKFWWFLEFLPMEFRMQLQNKEWKKWIGINLGRPREIPEDAQVLNGVKVHRTVKMRMDACDTMTGKIYRPRLKFAVEPTWVD